MEKLSAAREAAFRILLEVERGQAHADEMLRARCVERLGASDRNLATALVLGVLRWQLRLDEAIRRFLAKPKAKLDAEVRIALRIGAFQIYFLERIPARAAIDESVELAKQAGHRFAARMVNAVLRRLAEEPRLPEIQAKNEVEALAREEAHPVWLVERWAERYGLAAARGICRHGQRQARLHLRLGAAEAETALTAAGARLEPGALLACARVLAEGDVPQIQSFGAGRVRVQDEGSQLVAELAAACAPEKTEKVCDACAAPGGKTLVLAERLAAARMVACEVSEARCAALRRRLAGLGERVECRQMDAAGLSAEERFDLILVDAPCSGTGTLGRNPEIRHRLRPEDLARQAGRQRAILCAALRALRPGGRLVYSTCSLEFEEDEAVVAAALAELPAVRQIALDGAIDALAGRGLLAEGAGENLRRALTEEGALRLIPGRMPTDGFFMALLERRA